jgi:hypothetical protein
MTTGSGTLFKFPEFLGSTMYVNDEYRSRQLGKLTLCPVSCTSVIFKFMILAVFTCMLVLFLHSFISSWVLDLTELRMAHIDMNTDVLLTLPTPSTHTHTHTHTHMHAESCRFMLTSDINKFYIRGDVFEIYYIFSYHAIIQGDQVKTKPRGTANLTTPHFHMWYIYIYSIQGVPGGMCETSEYCSLC